MYVITGATGNIGSKMTARLLAKGVPVRLIGRSEDKLQKLAGDKGEKSVGTLEDTDFLARAFNGATAVFAMIPPNIQAEDVRAYQNKIGRAMAEAVKKAGVKHVISLSSVGAHLNEKAGVVQGLHDFEQMLNNIEGLNVLHLRATYFMENLFSSIESIKQWGMIGTPVKADLKFPMVATDDIAEIAAERLLKLDFKGSNVQYILGPEDVTYDEVAGIIGQAIGRKDLKYKEVSYKDTETALNLMGMSKDFSRTLVEFIEGMNDGRVFEDARRTPETTTGTTLDDFARTFAKVYNS